MSRPRSNDLKHLKDTSVANTKKIKQADFITLIESCNFDNYNELENAALIIDMALKQKILREQIVHWFFEGISATSNPRNWLNFLILLSKNKAKFDNNQAMPIISQHVIFKCIEKVLINKIKASLNIILLDLGFKYCENKKIYDLVTSDTSFIAITISILKKLSEIDRRNHIEKILPFCLIKYNSVMLQAMKKSFPEYFKSFENSLAVGDKKILLHLISLEENKSMQFTNQMGEFVNGFGRITYNGALLTCAEIRARKKDKDYVYNPTILLNSQFIQYLELLKSAPKPLRERFILSAPRSALLLAVESTVRET